MNFAVIDRHGFFRNTTTVRSTHGTAEAAVRVAKRDRVSIPGGPKIQSAAMVRPPGFLAEFHCGSRRRADVHISD